MTLLPATLISAILALGMPAVVLAQLPPAPTPVPGSLLDRPRSGATPAAEPRSPAPAAEKSAPTAGAQSAPDAGAKAAPREARRIGFGTAFRISPAGHLVTNRHVVEGCAAIGLVSGNKVTARLQLVATDPKHDLALLAGPPSADWAPLRAANEPVQGEDVLVYGFPLPGMLSASGQLGAGMVTALAGIRSDPDQLQIDAPIQRGNSGGPLLDRRGQVIGVVFAKLNALRIAQLTGDLPQNVNFAVRLAPLKALLDRHDVPYTIGDAGGRELGNQDIAARARTWTVPVACQKQR